MRPGMRACTQVHMRIGVTAGRIYLYYYLVPDSGREVKMKGETRRSITRQNTK